MFRKKYQKELNEKLDELNKKIEEINCSLDPNYRAQKAIASIQKIIQDEL